MNLDVRGALLSPEAQRDGTLWRGFTPTQNVTLSMLLKHFLMANYYYYEYNYYKDILAS